MGKKPPASSTSPAPPPSDFIRDIVAADVQSGKHPQVVTRFPPEPNGYLHIGHAKSICLNFGLSSDIPGSCTHLRFDDTNPVKEDVEYVESIKADVAWLGFSWGDHLYYASDYFAQIHTWALELIDQGLAYVCDLTADEMRATRGTLFAAGTPSPYRDRSVAENRSLFAAMGAGEFADGARTLRAKIDMAASNMNLRDPVLYRIKKVHHDRTGDRWCIYPTYDMAHGYSDAIEGITHSICTLEFEAHRPLYEWLIANVTTPHQPRQIEFARLNLTYTVMSKRRLLELVEQKLVDGWDDPRMPTISGMRRRGYSPAGVREFCRRIGITKMNSLTDVGLLEFAVREDLNKTAPRFMAVLRPLQVTIVNWPAGEVLDLPMAYTDAAGAPQSRTLHFSGSLSIEQEDYMDEPPPEFFRLGPGRTARLRNAFNITCHEVVKDAAGQTVELRCTYDPASRTTGPVKGTAVLHWLDAHDAIPTEVRLYDRLFTLEDMNELPEGTTYQDFLNPHSLEVLASALVEPTAVALPPGTRVQFERMGYFCVDTKLSRPGAKVAKAT
jgi:glutaminyl-tRNA synthetase